MNIDELIGTHLGYWKDDLYWHQPDGKIISALPGFSWDLNAMHLAEKSMNLKQALVMTIVLTNMALERTSAETGVESQVFHSSAMDHAKAFCEALKLSKPPLTDQPKGLE